MKTKITLTIATILLATLIASAQTVIPAGEVEGIWTYDQSPYEVQGGIYVTVGKTLTIEPGVEVKFNTTERFEIRGCLLAEGTEEVPILFTKYQLFEKWGGVKWMSPPSSNDSSKIDYCIFEHAYAYGPEYGYNSGGAIGVENWDKLSIKHSTFRFNKADLPGIQPPCGAAIALNNSSISISHCIFHNNAAKWGGAILLTWGSGVIIDNCLFYENTAEVCGGAIETFQNINPAHIINCTFADNHAGFGGGVFDIYESNPSLTNCILWNNTSDTAGSQVNIRTDTAAVNLYYCNVQEGEAGFSGYPNIYGEVRTLLDADPCFFGGGEYPYAFDKETPCMDYGTLDTQYMPEDWVCPCWDLADTTRVQDDYIDLGAYEARLITGANESNTIQISNMVIYPNPTTNNFTLNYYLQSTSDVNISLYSITGKKLEILSNQMTPRGEYKYNIDMTSLPVGTYFLKLQTGDEILTKKVVKL